MVMAKMMRTDEEDNHHDDSDYDNADKGGLCSGKFITYPHTFIKFIAALGSLNLDSKGS